MKSQTGQQSSDAIASGFIFAIAGAFVPLFVLTLVKGVDPHRLTGGALLLSLVGALCGLFAGLIWSYTSTDSTTHDALA